MPVTCVGCGVPKGRNHATACTRSGVFYEDWPDTGSYPVTPEMADRMLAEIHAIPRSGQSWPAMNAAAERYAALIRSSSAYQSAAADAQPLVTERMAQAAADRYVELTQEPRSARLTPTMIWQRVVAAALDADVSRETVAADTDARCFECGGTGDVHDAWCDVTNDLAPDVSYRMADRASALAYLAKASEATAINHSDRALWLAMAQVYATLSAGGDRD